MRFLYIRLRWYSCKSKTYWQSIHVWSKDWKVHGVGVLMMLCGSIYLLSSSGNFFLFFRGLRSRDD